MFYKSNVCQKDHILQDLNILPSFLDRGVIWSSPKHKSLVQSISDGSQFLNCKHRLPTQKVWNSKNANLKDLRIEKWRLHHQGSPDGTEMNHVIQPPHLNGANHRKFTVQHVGWRQHRLGGSFYKNPSLTYSTGILCSRCFTSEAHLRHSSYCVSSPIWVLKVSCSTEFTNVVNNWKRSNHVLLAIAFKRSTLYDVIEVNETTLNQVFILPHVANFDLLSSKNK